MSIEGYYNSPENDNNEVSINKGSYSSTNTVLPNNDGNNNKIYIPNSSTDNRRNIEGSYYSNSEPIDMKFTIVFTNRDSSKYIKSKTK